MNISFSLTKKQFLNRTKTVTRRLGWKDLKPGAVLQGVEKAQGLKKGEHIVPMGMILVADVRREPLSLLLVDENYGRDEVRKEGFPGMSPGEFVRFFCKANGGVWDGLKVTRIEFEYLEDP